MPKGADVSASPVRTNLRHAEGARCMTSAARRPDHLRHAEGCRPVSAPVRTDLRHAEGLPVPVRVRVPTRSATTTMGTLAGDATAAADPHHSLPRHRWTEDAKRQGG